MPRFLFSQSLCSTQACNKAGSRLCEPETNFCTDFQYKKFCAQFLEQELVKTPIHFFVGCVHWQLCPHTLPKYDLLVQTYQYYTILYSANANSTGRMLNRLPSGLQLSIQSSNYKALPERRVNFMTNFYLFLLYPNLFLPSAGDWSI